MTVEVAKNDQEHVGQPSVVELIVEPLVYPMVGSESRRSLGSEVLMARAVSLMEGEDIVAKIFEADVEKLNGRRVEVGDCRGGLGILAATIQRVIDGDGQVKADLPDWLTDLKVNAVEEPRLRRRNARVNRFWCEAVVKYLQQAKDFPVKICCESPQGCNSIDLAAVLTVIGPAEAVLINQGLWKIGEVDIGYMDKTNIRWIGLEVRKEGDDFVCAVRPMTYEAVLRGGCVIQILKYK